MQATETGSADSAPAPLFDAKRMFRYPLMVLVIFAFSAAALVATSRDMVDFRGKPLGYDFITFWGASKLTLEGQPEAAFDPAATLAAQASAVAGSEVDFFWHYPPTFQLMAAPLSLAPYPIAYLLFVLAGFAAYLLMLRPLVRQPHPRLLLAAFPAALICVYHGQNSLFSAALLGGAVWLADRGARGQLLAGLCIGLLAYKPQLGILVPFALAAAGQWRMFAAAAVASLAFAGAATLAFGPDLWRTFLDNLPFVQTLVESGALPWDKIPSAWVFMRMVGAPESIAYAVHIASALGAAGLTIYIWRRCGMTRLSWSVLIVATLMIPHYVFDYEFTLLAVPVAILMSDMAARGSSRTEKLTLLVVIALSGATAPITSTIGIQAGYPLLLCMLWLTTTRALKAAGADLKPLLPFGKRAIPA
jgi:hypothetical protein